MTHPAALIPTTSPLPPSQLVGTINDWLSSLKESWVGTAEPPNPVDGQWWLYTGNTAAGPIMRVRMAGAWRTVQSDVGQTVTDLDDALSDGFYRFGGAALNSPFPAGAAGTVIVSSRPAGLTQMAFRQHVAEAQLMFIRMALDGTGTLWTPWRRVYTQADVVGTVSKAGGAPSGALIESGELSSGRYVRFADGTQLCWGGVTLSYSDATELVGTWTVPRPFVNAFWRVSAIPRSKSSGSTWPMIGSLRVSETPTLTQVTLALARVTGAVNFAPGDTAFLHVFGIGSWAE